MSCLPNSYSAAPPHPNHPKSQNQNHHATAAFPRPQPRSPPAPLRSPIPPRTPKPSELTPLHPHPTAPSAAIAPEASLAAFHASFCNFLAGTISPAPRLATCRRVPAGELTAPAPEGLVHRCITHAVPGTGGSSARQPCFLPGRWRGALRVRRGSPARLAPAQPGAPLRHAAQRASTPPSRHISRLELPSSSWHRPGHRRLIVRTRRPHSYRTPQAPVSHTALGVPTGGVQSSEGASQP